MHNGSARGGVDTPAALSTARSAQAHGRWRPGGRRTPPTRERTTTTARRDAARPRSAGRAALAEDCAGSCAELPHRRHRAGRAHALAGRHRTADRLPRACRPCVRARGYLGRRFALAQDGVQARSGAGPPVAEELTTPVVLATAVLLATSILLPIAVLRCKHARGGCDAPAERSLRQSQRAAVITADVAASAAASKWQCQPSAHESALASPWLSSFHAPIEAN